MQRNLILVFLIVLLISSGCENQQQVLDTATKIESQATQDGDEVKNTEPPTIVPTNTTVATEEVIAEDVSAKEVVQESGTVVEDASVVMEEEVSEQCLECHIDKQRLIDTAAPEEVVENENEGEG